MTKISAITPILVVDEVEPCVSFWTERLGFKALATVPETGPGGEGPLGFAMLGNETLNVMYQTPRSILDDVPEVLGNAESHAQILFVIVGDLDDVMRRMEGIPVLVPQRTTFYGMREYVVREPGGHSVIFAQPIDA